MRLEPKQPCLTDASPASHPIIIPWARPLIEQAEIREVLACLEGGWLTAGPRVAKFEADLAERVGRKHGIAVNNGTSALQLALLAANISAGDEVIVPAYSYVATGSCVVMMGATPVFVDVDERNLCINPELISKRITKRTRAILVTDYGGNPCDYLALKDISEKKGLPLIVDGAQSIGATYNGFPTLGSGMISTTSFHAAKTITTGEGGMVFTDDDELAARCRIIRSQGEDPTRKYVHIELGFNFRMTEIQGAIGLAQLGKLDRLLADRRALAVRYDAELHDAGITKPAGLPKSVHSNFLYCLLVPNRDDVMARLKQRGIECRACYPLPLYRQPLFSNVMTPPCPVTERACGMILNLPMFTGLTGEMQHYVTLELREALAAANVEKVPLRKAV